MYYIISIFLFLGCSSPLKIQSDSFALTVEHSEWNTLLQKHVNEGGDVNYQAFTADKHKLDVYLKMLGQNPIGKTASKNEQLAYYINHYNAGTIQLILENYPIKSIKDIHKPWDIERVAIGDKKYSLGDIEHKILRKMNEPRIHFAINCASYSCPKLMNTAFTADRMEEQLEAAAQSFINDPKRNIITEEKAQVSEIFKWFKKDFTTKGSLKTYLNNYSEKKISPQAKVKYLDYKWGLNDSSTP